jgi:hypothetical protein
LPGLAEPHLDLIQPQIAGQSEVQVHLGMHRREVRDLSALVSKEVVGDYISLFDGNHQRRIALQTVDKISYCQPTDLVESTKDSI